MLLYSDWIAAISLLDESLVYKELLPLVSTYLAVIDEADSRLKKHGETARALTADPVRKTYWAYTDQSLFELIVGNEDRDVWKINLQKENFDVALKYAKARHFQNIAVLVLTYSGNRRQDRETSYSLRTHRRYSRQSGTSQQPKPSLSAQYHSRTSH